MEWYVYRHDTNKGKIIKYNVVNTGVIDHLIKMLNQIKEEKGHWNYDDFKEAAKQIYRYYYWSKSEHEIVIKEWVGKETEEKIDVFDQLMLNWDIFVDHLYDYVIELMSSKGEEENENCPENCLCRTCAAAKDCNRLNFYSCCGCRKTENDMVTRCISFVGEDAEEKKEEKPIIEDCLEDCLCKNCKGKADCGCVDCSHSIHEVIKSCRSFHRISSWAVDASQGRWVCANCEAPALYWDKDVFLSDFCPHCGASMENCSCGFMMK